MRAANDGTGVVLALGGGFSRGFAHLGVLEVLEQERIPVSAIVGTSIGGLLGAAYADGIPPRDLCHLGRHIRFRDFLRFRNSDESLERGECLGRFVRGWFRTKAVEDLPIPTVIVTTDLDTGAPYLFTRGSIEVAIRASCAFPGLFKPVEYEGRMLADGCIVSPVPTAIAALIHGGCVMGVAVSSVSANSPSAEMIANGSDPHFRFPRRSAVEPSWSRHADVMLEPEVHDIGWNDFSRVDEAFTAGANAMRRALPKLRELLAGRARSAASAMSAQPESGSSL
jgi:NTE family protein